MRQAKGFCSRWAWIRKLAPGTGGNHVYSAIWQCGREINLRHGREFHGLVAEVDRTRSAAASAGRVGRLFLARGMPMFGIGGRFISPENLDSRRWCFWMLVLYVASAMALLLATSFLGLRKYLRQRRMEMPLDMTATWVVAGSVLIVATIVVASLLPRPSPEYSIAQVIQVDSLAQWASRWGVGPEGGKSKPDQPSSSGTEQQEGQQADQQGSGKADPQNKSGNSNQGDKGSGQTNGKSDKSQQSQSQQGQSPQSQSKSDSSQSNSAQQSPGNGDQGKGDQNQNNQNQSDQNQNNQSQSDQTQSNSSNSGDDKGKSDQSRQSSENGQKSDEQAAHNSAESQTKSSEAENKSQRDQSQSSQSQSRQSQPNESTESSPNSNPQSPQIFRYLQTALESLRGLLKAMFYLALAIVAAVLAWRYRTELLAAWKKLLAELAALWPGLFGKKQPERASETSAPAPPRPFAQFSDPFASGAAARMSPAEVVRYTFAALEAWGHENGCPRDAGQTPHEFAAAIGELDSSLAREAAQLAELYARMAYAPPAAIRTSFEPLRALWRKMMSPAVDVVGA